MILFSNLKKRLFTIFNRQGPDDAFWLELEDSLIEADVGVEMTAKFISAAKSKRTMEEVKNVLAENMVAAFSPHFVKREIVPHVILVMGVNGVGKTTTIAKLAREYQNGGKSVLLVAADTFRAAAVEQLKKWGERLGIEVVAKGEGADAAAVAFDGVQKAMARKFDVVIIDTAGRLHTKQNLMEELKKVSRVIGKALSGAPHEKLLVIDATVGSNGLSQAREFHLALALTGIIVTKLDGTAKGGVVLAIAHELSVPITHVGLGEQMDDLKPFEPASFVAGIIG